MGVQARHGRHVEASGDVVVESAHLGAHEQYVGGGAPHVARLGGGSVQVLHERSAVLRPGAAQRRGVESAGACSGAEPFLGCHACQDSAAPGGGLRCGHAGGTASLDHDAAPLQAVKGRRCGGDSPVAGEMLGEARPAGVAETDWMARVLCLQRGQVSRCETLAGVGQELAGAHPGLALGEERRQGSVPAVGTGVDAPRRPRASHAHGGEGVGG